MCGRPFRSRAHSSGSRRFRGKTSFDRWPTLSQYKPRSNLFPNLRRGEIGLLMQLLALHQGSKPKGVIREAPLGELRCFRSKDVASRTARRAAAVFLSLLLLLSTMSMVGWSQTVRRSPNQDERDGISAGGDWAEFRSDDKMTGAKRARFELLARNSFREDPDFQPRVELYCSAGKLTRADFDPERVEQACGLKPKKQ